MTARSNGVTYEYWQKVERHVRDLTKSNKGIEVFTGPFFVLEVDEKGQKWVKYCVIGENNIAVPSHFFKIVIMEDHNGKKQEEAYVLPNKAIAKDTPLEKFKTTVERIEKLAGVKFFESFQ